MSAKPDPNSPSSRIRAWFMDPANADEELTYDDMVVKFGTKHHNVSLVIRQMVEQGLVEVRYVRETIARRKK